MNTAKLYCITMGATVLGRLIEQHDVMFAAARDISDLIPSLQAVWPAGSSVHVDAYREVNTVGAYRIDLVQTTANTNTESASDLKLFFFNLGGYVEGDMEEYHHKALIVAATQKEAIATIKQSEFYQHRGYAGAESHIDDKMSVDIDDVHIVDDLLADSGWQLHISANDDSANDDVWQVGYLSLSKLAKRAASLEA
ncbi:DUF1543 domain-containing protein [Vitreoscilla massiliensis]|uniref:DUF1543 domain-containing protein n=1 Tax=Vitreoscilla massiliensis TaxID=1689272 RepID=A0ABY4E2W2_9NEIS|nr:DUF1543 domain-containing protein [Vitreoscilla massiliensis]UOO90116.1 DUF1543 domain-containing protein [Vitreoscilla massiliensis]